MLFLHGLIMARIFLLIDTSHMLHRVRHVTSGDIWTQTGLSLHIMLNSIKKCWNLFEATHTVFCLDGKSWRKEFYKPYKKNREVLYAAKTESDLEADEIFFSGVNSFIEFIDRRCNCTVLQSPICEADDLIARWIQTHPDDNHVIVSGDTDFIQLLAENVQIYDGIRNLIIKKEGVFNEKLQPIHFQVKSDSKLKIFKEVKKGEEHIVSPDWIDWALFIKLVRGDPGDNVFSAYPKVRLNEIRKAFDDRDEQSYNWQNFMFTRWTDHNNNDHRVRDCFERNRILIDLSAQPDEIIEELDNTISDAVQARTNNQIGLHLLKFCGKYELTRIADHPGDYTPFLSAAYSE